jgi:hypothetical protein
MADNRYYLIPKKLKKPYSWIGRKFENRNDGISLVKRDEEIKRLEKEAAKAAKEKANKWSLQKTFSLANSLTLSERLKVARIVKPGRKLKRLGETSGTTLKLSNARSKAPAKNSKDNMRYTKLSIADVHKIRDFIADGVHIPSIAKAFKVTPVTIYKIRSGALWSMV